MFLQYLLSSIIIWAFFLQCLTRLAAAQAPLLHDPGTSITDEELNATYTHLVGFEGCGLLLQRDIIQAFWDAAAVLNRDNIRNSQPGDSGIDWKLPAAVEYLGSPFSQPFWGTIQNLYSHAATFEPSRVSWPTDFTINARCDDPRNLCLCVPSNTTAYTLNTGGSNNNGPYINFCPKFFAQPDLSTVLGTMPSRPPVDRYNVALYNNKAETFMHEMFHIDRISSAPPNTHVTDLWVQIRPNYWFQVFGPELSKALARTTTNTGQYVMQTSENLMYFAMVTHYQAVLNGQYPSRPFAQDIPVGTPQRHRPYSLFDFSARTLKVSNESALSLVAQTISPASATCAVEAATTFAATSAPFAADTDYPADYQSSLSSWKSTWDAYWATATPIPAPSPSGPSPLPPPPPSSPPSAADSCGDWYDFFFDHFEIHGKNFDANKFGADGSGLKKNIQGCGALTKWSFQQTPTNSSYQWFASGNLPIGTKSCVGRAVVAAGGQSPDGCTGAG